MLFDLLTVVVISITYCWYQNGQQKQNWHAFSIIWNAWNLSESSIEDQYFRKNSQNKSYITWEIFFSLDFDHIGLDNSSPHRYYLRSCFQVALKLQKLQIFRFSNKNRELLDTITLIRDQFGINFIILIWDTFYSKLTNLMQWLCIKINTLHYCLQVLSCAMFDSFTFKLYHLFKVNTIA